MTHAPPVGVLSSPRAALGRESARSLLEKMYLIRFFEERVKRLYTEGRVGGPLHLYLGEEAVAAGVCEVLREDDYITSTHRGHGHCIAKGADPKYMMAEILGKETGYCGGRGGSMHICDMNLGILGAAGIVGSGLPIAVGAAYSAQYGRSDRVTVCFFGDGASNQGTFHEALNMAGLWRLPIVFVCEYNGYAITTPMSDSLPIPDIAVRARGYGFDGLTIDGNDVLSVYAAAADAVQKGRSGGGPTLIECKTYRMVGHWLGDPVVYRTKEEVAAWARFDPIERYRGWLCEQGLMKAAEMDSVRDAALAKVDEAEQFAQDSPYPAPASVEDNVYCEVDPSLDRGR